MWSSVKGPTRGLRWNLLAVLLVFTLNFKVSEMVLATKWVNLVVELGKFSHYCGMLMEAFKSGGVCSEFLLEIQSTFSPIYSPIERSMHLNSIIKPHNELNIGHLVRTKPSLELKEIETCIQSTARAYSKAQFHRLYDEPKTFPSSTSLQHANSP